MSPVAPAVVKAVVEAYYPEALKEAGAARTRAQAGYAVAGAIATAIVGAGLIKGLGTEREVVQAVGVVAVLAWLATALLYSWAVAGRVELPSAAVAGDADAFVTHVIDTVKAQREVIEDRINYAFAATVCAVLVTLLTLVLTMTTAAPTISVQGQFVLTKVGRDSVTAVCGDPGSVMSGRVDPAALAGSFTKITIDKGACPERKKAVEVRLVKGSIASFVAP